MTNDVSRMVVLLYASMIEQTDSFLLLANNGRRAGTHAIFRSFLEAYVDLKALAQDDTYLHHMYASYHREWLRVLREADTRSNQYLASIGAHKEFFGTQQSHAGKLEKLKTDPAGHILVCMHGRAMRAFLCQLLHLELRCMEGFEHQNLCLYKIVFTGSLFYVKRYCDRRHLQNLTDPIA